MIQSQNPNIVFSHQIKVYLNIVDILIISIYNLPIYMCREKKKLPNKLVTHSIALFADSRQGLYLFKDQYNVNLQ